MSDLHEARIEAAARALRDDKANRVDTYAVPEWEDTSYGDKLVYLGQARAALAAADAVVTVEMIVDELAGHPIGTGYYQTTVGVDEAREMAEAIQRLCRGEGQSSLCDCPVTALTVVDGCEHDQRRQGT